MSLQKCETRLTYMFRDVLSQDPREFRQRVQDQSRFFAHTSETDGLQLAHDDVLHIIYGNTKHINEMHNIDHCVHRNNSDDVIWPTGKIERRPPIAV